MQTATARPSAFLPHEAVSLGHARGDFARLARGLMIARDPFDARSLGLIRNGSERLQLAAKAAVGAGSLADAEATGALVAVTSGWLESLRSVGAYDALLPDMRVGAMEQRFSVVTTAIVAPETGEGLGVPVKRIDVTSAQPLRPKKVAAICVISRELARFSESEQLIDNELRGAVAAGTDKVFLDALVAASTPIPSTGAIADLDALLGAVPLGPTSRPHWVFSPSAAKSLTSQRDPSGARVWPDARPTGGGAAYGIPIEISDMLAAGTALLVDASGLAGNGGSVELDTSNQTSIEMDSAPVQDGIAGTGATLVSLWQSNQVGVKATRYFAFEILRAGGVAAVSGIAWAAP